MKTRAELLKERAEKEKALKKAHGEEAPATPDKPAPKTVFDCKPCGATCVVAECTVRSNGHIECIECGAPHHPDDVRPAGEVPPPETAKKPPAKTTTELAKETEQKQEKREADKAARLPPVPPKFCGACAAPLTWAPGVSTYFYGCGHTKEHGMADSANEAKKSAELYAKAVAAMNAPMEIVPRQPETTAPLVRLNIQWGKSRCPLDRFNAFEVGGFSITVDLQPTDDHVAIGKRLLSDLEAIAEESFKRQKAWYEKKLGILGVERE